MAAPKRNQFWKLRSKHGRERLFSSPDDLWSAACEYFNHCEQNPLIEVDFMGKEAMRVERPKMRPFTMQGLCLYLRCNTGYFSDFKENLKRKHDLPSEDFSEVITRIEETIYDQKFTGAAVGLFNANIIARDLGLMDKKELAVQKDITVEYFDGSAD